MLSDEASKDDDAGNFCEVSIEGNVVDKISGRVSIAERLRDVPGEVAVGEVITTGFDVTRDGVPD